VKRYARRAARVMATAALLVVTTARCATDAGTGNAVRQADDTTTVSVQRLALDSLFSGREHAQRLVLWATDAPDGPALEALGSAVRRPAAPRVIDVTRLAPSLPARTLTEDAVADLFRRNPDGWAAFYREHPGSSGLVELSPVWLAPDGTTATTYVGRSCGEHCRHAWRLRARRQDGRWRIGELTWVRVPGA
jgi:hypothetical protein